MQHLIAPLIIIFCFALMAIGLLAAKKTLRKACSDDPSSCACRQQGRPPEACDDKKK